MATVEEVQSYLTRALGLLNSLTAAIEYNTRNLYDNALQQFEIIENNVFFETSIAANNYRWARYNILNQVGYAHGQLLTDIKSNFEAVFTNVNLAWQETLTVVAGLRAAAENVLFNYISDIVKGVGDKIWDSQKQIISFILEGFNFVNAKMAVGFTGFAEGLRDILNVIPDKVWSYLESWLEQEVPE